MKNSLFILLTFSVVATLLLITKSNQSKTSNIIPPDNSNGFVVMELFTSQGCSSCPRADDLLGEYAAKNDDHIIPIAFHVDYWNYLGWKDSFATLQYTQRQENYDANFLHATVYTPQLIINGEKEMVGSEKEKIKNAVHNALNEEPAVSIELTDVVVNNGKVQASYGINGKIDNTTLNTALIQNRTITKIKAGENDGATLTNYNVVRNFITMPAKGSDNVVIAFPAGVDTKDLAIVLFTQDNATGKITAAVKRLL